MSKKQISKKIFLIFCIFPFFLNYAYSNDELKIGLPADIVMLDPQLAQTGSDWEPGAFIWNRLVEYDDTMMNPIPSIAESWETSNDGKIWKFKIRKGIKFHSGRELTSEDVDYSFKRGFEIGKKGRFAGYMVSVDSFKPLSKYEFEVKLKQVDVTFLPNLAVQSASIVD